MSPGITFLREIPHGKAYNWDKHDVLIRKPSWKGRTIRDHGNRLRGPRINTPKLPENPALSRSETGWTEEEVRLRPR